MIRYHQRAADALSRIIPAEHLGRDQILALLERPQNSDHGDIAFPCFLLAKAMREAPPKIASRLAGELTQAGIDCFAAIQATGPYINFRITAAAAMVFLEEARTKPTEFGRSRAGKGKKILLEYSSPNVAKEFHIGHFRNTILGQALYNLYQATGHELIAINHLGDWGSQFGKVAYAFEQWGDEAKLQEAALSYLTTLYVKFHDEAEKNPELDREARLWFKRIEDGEPAARKLWQRFVELSIEDLKRVYAKLGVRFDHYLGESFYFDKVEGLVRDLRAKGLLQESEGAQIVSLDAYDMPPCLILTGDGTTLYHTRDLAAAVYRKQTFQFDRCLYVVGSEQSLHFQQVFKVLELMGYKWAADLEHVKYGLYRFKDGKFSTRKGKVVLFQEVLDEAMAKVAAIIAAKNPELKNKAEVTEAVALGALVFNDLATDRVKDVEFDWEKILDFEGDTGPYLQYTHARAASILRKAETAGVVSLQVSAAERSAELARHESAVALMKQLGRLSAAIDGAVRLGKPSIIAHYGLDLAKAFNSFYRSVKVLDDSESAETIQTRLGLVEGARNALRVTLGLICMKAPEEM